MRQQNNLDTLSVLVERLRKKRSELNLAVNRRYARQNKTSKKCEKTLNNNHPLRSLARIPLLGDMLEFVYCGLLIGLMIWTASAWRWAITSLIVVEVVFVALMLIGYFWIVSTIKRTLEDD